MKLCFQVQIYLNIRWWVNRGWLTIAQIWHPHHQCVISEWSMHRWLLSLSRHWVAFIDIIRLPCKMEINLRSGIPRDVEKGTKTQWDPWELISVALSSKNRTTGAGIRIITSANCMKYVSCRIFYVHGKKRCLATVICAVAPNSLLTLLFNHRKNGIILCKLPGPIGKEAILFEWAHYRLDWEKYCLLTQSS